MTTHPWLLTAPWWHWPRLGTAGPDPRETRPALQKYAAPDAVNQLLADPQRRLLLTEHDLAGPSRHGLASGVPLGSASAVRKLYLPSHHRHYLVVCELHCDAPGLPSPGRDQVCDAGFVIRRRSVEVPPEATDDARRRLRELTLARAQLGTLDRKIQRVRRTNGVAAAHREVLAGRRERAFTRVAERERGLREWALAAGVARGLQGWFPLGVDPDDDPPQPRPLPERPSTLRPVPGLGRWAPVAEVPDELTETTVGLHPLIADPDDEDHDATDRTLFFGLVPTVSAELAHTPPPADPAQRKDWTDRGPRFGELDLYEIRCFVRRHDPGCPRRVGRHDCRGPVVWSEPTEPYRLAAHLDPRGTAHRPVTITMPDLGDLREQTRDLVGMGGVRVATPPGSQLDTPGGPGGGVEQICSFAIPLITIVAMFVLKLFLPIIVFLFGLWWMLALRLCIPPSVAVSGELAADIEARGPEVEIDADLAATIETGVESSTMTVVATAKKLGDPDDAAADIPGGIADGLTGQTGADRYPAVRALLGTSGLRAPDDDLRYAPRVARAEVFAP